MSITPPENREEWITRQALERPEAERTAFLETACGGDTALLQRVVGLLRAKEAAATAPQGTVVDPNALRQGIEACLQAEQTGPAPSEPPTAAPQDPDHLQAPAPEERPGSVIGRYHLLEKIGEGGFGTVYVAEQLEPVRRQVALKVIKLGMDTRQVVARFEAERQALAMMDHPNIAKVLDAGATDSGRPYFVMELVRGINITKYCDENNLPTQKRLELFIQTCQAIQHAHQKGIIHRDIKPSNILVNVHDGVAVPKVIDFGIAKATEQRLTEKTLFTALGQFIGTPMYMSPEQASGSDVDTRSDIYSLGALLYELLTGKMPFDPKELLAGGLAHMCQIIREEEPVRPSSRLDAMLNDELTTTARQRRIHPASLVHLVRGDLDWIVMKALEKDRVHRYETANALAMDITRYLKHDPVSAAAPSARYLCRKFMRRHKAGLATASALLLILMAGAALSLRQAAVARREARAAREQAAGLYDERAWALGKEGDDLGAFCSFVQALRISKPGSKHETVERLRLGFLSQTIPKLEAGFALPRLAEGEQFESTFNLLWKGLRSSNVQSSMPFFPHPGAADLLFSPDQHWLVEPQNHAIWDLRDGNPLRQLRMEVDSSWVARVARFSPNGKHLVLCGWLSRTPQSYGSPRGQPAQRDVLSGVHVFEVDGWREVTPAVTLTGAVLSVGFSIDSQRFFAAVANLKMDSFDRIVDSAPRGETFFFNVTTGQRIAGLTNVSVGLNSDGSQAASFAWPESEIFVADAERLLLKDIPRPTSRLSQAPPSRSSPVEAIFNSKVGDALNKDYFFLAGPPSKLSPDAKAVLAMTRRPPSETAQIVEIRDVVSGKLLHSLPHPDEVMGARFSPDGLYVLTTCRDFGVRLWDAATGQQITSTLKHEAVPLIAFCPDGHGFVTVVRQEVVRVWSLIGQSPPQTILVHPAEVHRAMFNPAGDFVVTACRDGFVRCWDSGSGEVVARSPRQDSGVTEMAFWPDGAAVTCGTSNVVQVMDIPSLKPKSLPLISTNTHDVSVLKICLSPNGRFAAEVRTAGLDSETLEIWEIAPHRLLKSESFQGQIRYPSFSTDSRRLGMQITTARHRVWKVYEIPSTKGLVIDGWSDTTSPDGERFAIADSDAIYFGRVGQEGSVRLQYSANINHVAFSPDANLIIASSEDSLARIWDLTTRRTSGPALRHQAPVLRACWSSDGRLVATASKDRTVRVWDAGTGEPVTPPLTHEAQILDVAFSGDARRLLTVAQDHTVRIWKLPREERPDEMLRLIALITRREEKSDHPLNSNEDAGTGYLLLRSKYGAAMTNSPEALRNWHESVAHKAASNEQWFAAAFHLKILCEGSPSDESLRARLLQAESALASSQVDARKKLLQALAPQSPAPVLSTTRVDAGVRDPHPAPIPPRDPSATSEQLDLSPFYNVSLDETLHWKPQVGNSLANLPRGLHTFGDVKFEVRGVIQLSSAVLEQWKDGYPERVDGIPLSQRCHSLHFLHASGIPLTNVMVIGSYVVHYADGELHEIPIVYGEDVLDWYALKDELQTSKTPVVAWAGRTPANVPIRLFHSSWQNPRPDVTIQSMDYVSKMTDAGPFLIAITVEP